VILPLLGSVKCMDYSPILIFRFTFASSKNSSFICQLISITVSSANHDYLPNHPRDRQQRHHQSCCEKQRLRQWTNQVSAVVRWYIFSPGGSLLSSAGSRYATDRHRGISPLLTIIKSKFGYKHSITKERLTWPRLSSMFTTAKA
jgi:hypothetical protein